MAKLKMPTFSDDEIRRIMLDYFFERNRNATSRRGKKTGAAVPISVLRADLKASHGLHVTQVQSNLTYLLSQGWVEDQPEVKTHRTRAGTDVPRSTSYFVITAAGIDKISGPSEFTRDRFEGIRIEATGQNIITLGDGNQVNVQFREVGEALAELRRAVSESSELGEDVKVDLVVDIDSIQDQLAKPSPNRSVVSTLWKVIERGASVAGLAEAAGRVAKLLGPLVA